MLARLKAFAASRNGKLTLGGTATAGAVVLALVTRRRAGGDPTPAAADDTNPLPSYLQTTGTGGANTGGAVNEPTPDGTGGIDPGAFEELLANLGRQSDAFEEFLNRPPPEPTTVYVPAPAPYVPPVYTPPAVVVDTGNATAVGNYTPPPPPPPSAPANRTYTVVSGDNLSKIAQRYYGRQDWQKIYNANKGVIGGNPNLIKPGQVLVIPY